MGITLLALQPVTFAWSGNIVDKITLHTMVNLDPVSIDAKIRNGDIDFDYVVSWPLGLRYSNGELVDRDDEMEWTINGNVHHGSLRNIREVTGLLPQAQAEVVEVTG